MSGSYIVISVIPLQNTRSFIYPTHSPQQQQQKSQKRTPDLNARRPVVTLFFFHQSPQRKSPPAQVPFQGCYCWTATPSSSRPTPPAPPRARCSWCGGSSPGCSAWGKHMEKMWKNIWFEDIGIWHLEYFLAKDFKVVHVWKGTLAAFCFYECKMSWSSAQFVGNRILIISFQTLTIGLMMQLHGRKQLLSLDFGRVFKCNSFKLIFLFRRQIN